MNETLYELVDRVLAKSFVEGQLPYHPGFCGPCWQCKQIEEQHDNH